MRFSRFTLGFILVFTSATTCWADYKQINEVNPDDPMAVHIYKLENGLMVYLTENHQTPRFYSEVAVRAGSKNDPAETTGLAHYLEHLLFKGNQQMGTLDFEKEKPHFDRIIELYEQHFRETDPEKRAAIYAEIGRETQASAEFVVPNELDNLYKAMGGSGVNAHTWHEETVYKVELPANRIAQWAAIESSRFINPVFRLFQPELEIVYEEKNRAMDNKDRVINEAVATALYKEHPYGRQDTLGSIEHLKNPSIVNIYKFFNTYYVPNNMAICISGDIDIPDTIELIDRAFSDWQSKKLPKPKKWREKPIDGVERVSANYPGEEYVLLVFRTAKRSHRDADALELLDMVLSNSVAGLIDLNLVHQQRVRAAGAYPQMYNDYGAEYLWGIPKDGQSLEEVEQLLLEQLERVKNGELEDWIIPAIITDFKKNQKASLESDRSRVSTMREAFLEYKDWDDVVARIARMEKLTKDDVVRVAHNYFGTDYVAGYRHDAQHEVPSIEKPKMDKITIDPTRQSEFARSILAMPVEPIDPVFVDPSTDYTVADDSRGIRFYYAPNPLNDLFTLSFVFDIGTYEDNRFGTAAGLLDKSGTEKFSPEDLQKEWYKLGTGFSMGSGFHETSVSISGLDENFEESVALMMDVLTNPSAPQETLDQLIRIILVQREDGKKDPNTIQNAMVQYNRLGAESSFLRALPGDRLTALTREELFGLVKQLLTYKHAILYTGSLPMNEVQEVLARLHPIDTPLADPPPFTYLTARAPQTSEIYLFDKEVAQSQVRIEFGLQAVDEEATPAIQLFNSYFGGGMSGVVFQEIREARALAYSAGAHYLQGNRTGEQDLMLGGMGTQTDKTPEALAAFIGLLDDMPVSEDRFTVAKESVVNGYRTDKLGFREVLGAVRSWERLGLAVDPRQPRFDRIQSGNLETVTAFYNEHIKGKPKLISITGDKKRFDMNRIAEFGTIRELTIDELFVK